MGKCLFMRKGETHTAPINGILASDLAVGSTVKLMENGVAAEYLVVNQGIPQNSTLYDASCNGTWLLRKDLANNIVWSQSGGTQYFNSDIHAYLVNDFWSSFDSETQNIIKQVKIPHNISYNTVNSGSNGLSTKIFLLGGYEVGFTETLNSYFPVDGAKLEYFESGDTQNGSNRAKRIAYRGGVAAYWFLRTPQKKSGSNKAFRIDPNGSYDSPSTTGATGVRPCVILPSNALFDKDTLILKGVS